MTIRLKSPEELASEHVEWLIRLLIPIIRKVGTENFMHGYKHGKESNVRSHTRIRNNKRTSRGTTKRDSC